MGTTELALPQWTVERVPENEAEPRAEDVEQRVVAAVDEATGEVVGLTEVAGVRNRPGEGFARGHRLTRRSEKPAGCRW
ncbi:hypothetical protein B0I31_10863 [Saccharothrix carnea]|uniref:Uncharacterized protein n=1 Tax=Saccharothrix carnea TaxID=1280637 RepID=A0A2P8I584_SACCR|nr:hypothetical protein [Saccharothrix carnea]PSL53616.1 hypothetical protein B0I31_10863 [Saccharothrix carnea]